MIQECPRLIEFVHNAIAITARKPGPDSTEAWSAEQFFSIFRLQGVDLAGALHRHPR
jgi:hypothetical protein